MDMPSPRQLRLLAPVALVFFLIAGVLIVAGTSGGSSHTSVSRATLEKDRDLGLGRFASPRSGSAPAGAPSSGGTYVVQQGDTLGSIAAKTGISVSRLQALNPSVDPQSLLSGQKLRLR